MLLPLSPSLLSLGSSSPPLLLSSAQNTTGNLHLNRSIHKVSMAQALLITTIRIDWHVDPKDRMSLWVRWVQIRTSVSSGRMRSGACVVVVSVDVAVVEGWWWLLWKQWYGCFLDTVWPTTPLLYEARSGKEGGYHIFCCSYAYDELGVR